MTSSSVSDAFREAYKGASLWRLWTSLAVEDLRTTYKRSAIGVAWIALSFALFLSVKVVIFGSISGTFDNKYFSVYVAVGFFAWQYMSQVMLLSPSVFTRAENWLSNDPLPLFVFVFQNVCRCAFDLLVTGAVVVLTIVVLGYGYSWYSLLSIPAIILYLLNSTWIMILVGIVSTKYRDVGHFVQAGTRVMFFLTPIFWFPSQLPQAVMDVLWWNPFSHFIWILRTPVLDGNLALESWIYVGVVTLVGWALAMTTYVLFKKRIVYWF